MLVDLFYCMFLCGFPFFFLSFFPLLTEKYEKTCFNAKTNDFDPRTAYRAPVCWSKYTTLGVCVFGAFQEQNWKENKPTFYKYLNPILSAKLINQDENKDI